MVDVRLLGPIAVVGDDGPVALGGPRQRAALAVLALTPNEIVSLDRLVDDVWPSDPPDTATTTLQAYISRLRRVLAPLGLQILARKPGYLLAVDADRVDARRFEALVVTGRDAAAAGDHLSASRLLAAGLALWHGPALADFVYEPFAEAEIRRLEELRLAALEERIEADLALGRAAQIVPELEALTAEHPLRERFRGQLMRALHWSGRRADALRVYRDARERLAEELGIEPGTELQRLEHAILMQDDEVEPAVPEPAAGRLPVAITSFVGRQRELIELRELVATNRVVTIVGPGGAGKTRLALETATAAARSFPAGAWMVELASARTADQVVGAFAHALDVQEEPDRPLRETLVVALAERSCLLVVDNCEQVNAEAAALVAELVTAGRGVRVLATSRQALEIAGEVAWPIPSLDLPPAGVVSLEDALRFDAVRLLVDRAATAAPGLGLGDADAGALVSIARRLDGMPLGLELAAGRLRGLSPAEIDGRLDDRFRLLAAGSSANVERHRTLEAAVEWSYELLDEAERHLFDRLSVLAGSFTIDMAEAVCGGGEVAAPEVVDLLTSLVAKSLVARVDVAGGVSRYRLLETLRSFGGARLAARGEGPAVRERHAAYCRARAEAAAPDLRGSRWEAALQRYERERDDYHAALDWLLAEGRGDDAVALAAAVWPFWHRAVNLEGWRWMSRALALPSAENRQRLTALVGAAALAILADDLDGAHARIDEALDLAGRLDEDGLRAHALLLRGEIRRLWNDHGGADDDARTAADLAGQAGEPWIRADALRVRLLVAWDRGDAATAAGYGAEALELWTGCGDVGRAAGARSVLGQFAAERGRFDEAAALYEESLAGFQAAGEPDGVAHAVLCLARLALDQGDPEAAAVLSAECQRQRDEMGDMRGSGQACSVRAVAALQAGRPDEAERHLRAALDRLEAIGFGGDLAVAFQTAAWIAMRQGRPAVAREWYDRWRAGVESVGAHRQAVRGLCLTAVMEADGGDIATARAAAEQARALAGEIEDHRGRAVALETLAAVAVADDQPEEAAVLLRAAHHVRTEHGVVTTPDERSERERLSGLLAPVIDLTGSTDVAGGPGVATVTTSADFTDLAELTGFEPLEDGTNRA